MTFYLNRLFSRACCFAVLILTLSSGVVSAETTTGFLTLNPWLDDTTSGDLLLDDPDGVFWTLNPEWEVEPFAFDGALMFPTSATNAIGLSVAEAGTIDLTTQPNVTGLSNYDPSTTELTDITFEDPWRVGHFGAVPQDGDYNYFIEFTIQTPGGDYRAATQKLDRPTVMQNTIAQVGFVFTWETVGFLGDPFTGGAGIPLDQITNIDYDVIMEVITPTTTIDQFGDTGFFNVQGFNVMYEVTSASSTDPADLNSDGFVDGLDLGILLGNWGTSTTPGNGELDGNPPVDGLDLGILLGAWNPPPAAATAAVPEPTSILLAGLGALILVSNRR